MNLRYILAKILAVITRQDRYFPDVEWSDKSYVHNFFRFFEFIWGRRVGIRLEMSSYCYMENGVVYESHCAHTFEASCALFETWVRSRMPKPFRIYIPKFVTPQGIQIPASPFLFAIAYDTSGSNTFSASPRTWSHTCTGSNLKLFITPNSTAGATPSAVTYNSIAYTAQVQTLQTVANAYDMSMFYKDSPSTGANTVSVTCASNVGGGSFSYTGCATGIDSSNKGLDAGTTLITGTTTVVVANCWLIMTGTSGGANPTGGTGTTLRLQWQGGTGTGDSNGTVATGARSLVFNTTHISNEGGYVIASFAPFVSATVNSGFLNFF